MGEPHQELVVVIVLVVRLEGLHVVPDRLEHLGRGDGGLGARLVQAPLNPHAAHAVVPPARECVGNLGQLLLGDVESLQNLILEQGAVHGRRVPQGIGLRAEAGARLVLQGVAAVQLQLLPRLGAVHLLARLHQQAGRLALLAGEVRILAALTQLLVLEGRVLDPLPVRAAQLLDLLALLPPHLLALQLLRLSLEVLHGLALRVGLLLHGVDHILQHHLLSLLPLCQRLGMPAHGFELALRDVLIGVLPYEPRGLVPGPRRGLLGDGRVPAELPPCLAVGLDRSAVDAARNGTAGLAELPDVLRVNVVRVAALEGERAAAGDKDEGLHETRHRL
mmetsp:Transcript_22144/g.62871  ORF Transcript_22144/g.62871 Transcript_22144/m.62871 type:complete len:334 (+) Transcript_22144:1020-2021(+)